MGPGAGNSDATEEGYELERKWFEACRLSHDLWCLCPDYRQHFLPGCGVIVPVGDAGDGTAPGGGGDSLDEVMVTFDMGEAEAITADDG